MNFTGYLVTYDDGSYAIEGLYGSDDKLEFTVDENNELVITNAYNVSEPYYCQGWKIYIMYLSISRLQLF